jgi:methylated-DNA-[protein]-cysteine S-methyltransferase
MPAFGDAPVAAFTSCPAPWGLLHVATTATGIVAVGLNEETPGFVDRLARRLHGHVVPAEDGDVPVAWRAMLNGATGQLREFFADERQGFDVPIDLRVSDWDRLVLTGAARLQFGETASYGELAGRIGRPGAAQAVGGAMGRNPVPILIPCHRIIGAGGALGGYGGSTFADRQAALGVKRRLLALEGSWAAD